MIENIINMLKVDFPHNSEYIAIAKGKYKLPTTIKEALTPLNKMKWPKM
jgi:hypothetical protein